MKPTASERGGWESRNPDNTVGIGPIKQEEDDLPAANIKTDYLKEAVEMAEEEGWENCYLWITPDHAKRNCNWLILTEEDRNQERGVVLAGRIDESRLKDYGEEK